MIITGIATVLASFLILISQSAGGVTASITCVLIGDLHMAARVTFVNGAT